MKNKEPLTRLFFNLVQTLNQTIIQKQEGDEDEDDTI